MRKDTKSKSASTEQKLDALIETVDHLAISVARGFEKMATKDEMNAGFESVNKRLDDIDFRLGKIESNHERRLDILEDRMRVVKTYFERNPRLKVKF